MAKALERCEEFSSESASRARRFEDLDEAARERHRRVMEKERQLQRAAEEKVKRQLCSRKSGEQKEFDLMKGEICEMTGSVRKLQAEGDHYERTERKKVDNDTGAGSRDISAGVGKRWNGNCEIGVDEEADR